MILERLRKFLDPVKSIGAEEAEEFMEDLAEGSFTLLDVRQPREYDSGHIPGAKLIPLPELSDSVEELDKSKPVVVY